LSELPVKLDEETTDRATTPLTSNSPNGASFPSHHSIKICGRPLPL
jgi:hypothetical protein